MLKLDNYGTGFVEEVILTKFETVKIGFHFMCYQIILTQF